MFAKQHNKIKLSKGEKVGHVLIVILMVLLCVSVIYPFMNMLAISLSDKNAINRREVTIFPVDFDGRAYGIVAQNKYLWLAYGNTLYVCVVGTIFGVILTAFAAYPMAFNNFGWNKVYSVFITITMWFSAGSIPSFIIVNKLGLFDNHWALILTGLLSAYNVIVMRAFFASVSKSIVEAAQIDGANDMFILFIIVLPMSKAVIATIALWSFIAQWNSYMGPLLYIRTKEKYTLQLLLQEIVLNSALSDFSLGDKTDYVSQEQVKNAILVFSILPTLVIYPFIQKYFSKGVMIGAVKG